MNLAGYLTKPVTPAELKKMTFAVLERTLLQPSQSSVRLEMDRPLISAGIRGPNCQQASLVPRLRILLAEDNPVNQRLAVRLLEKWGQDVLVVSNGREAVRALEGQYFDLVLMDVQMPELDGLEATVLIREREQWIRQRVLASSTGPSHSMKDLPQRRIPIVAMTAYAMKGDKERCLNAGMDDYISKPIESKELLKAISRLLPEVGFITRQVKVESISAEVAERDWTLKLLDGDSELLTEIVELFLEDYPTQLTCIREALKQGDGKVLERSAHTFKGSLSHFGAESAVEAALQLEKMGQQGDLTHAWETYALLEQTVERLKPSLKALRSGD